MMKYILLRGQKSDVIDVTLSIARHLYITFEDFHNSSQEKQMKAEVKP